ncbi:MAG: hypothetical protein Q8R76_07490 [Candidatus Omnitrophota bacterium]|nr:hypothetical protein [Candidatus Omnitrophota bacterium]
MRAWIIGFVAVLFYAVTHALHRGMTQDLVRPGVFTGWVLFSVIMFLALFNIRKKMPMIPLGSAHTWLLLHVAGGLLAFSLFVLHTGSFWPTGAYEQVLAFLLYLITLSGIAGYILQRIYPARLTETDLEVIYERIPAEIASIREKAEQLILECAEKTTSDTLPKNYLNDWRWYFKKPRFFLSHAMGRNRGHFWIRNHGETVRRYLSQAEVPYLNELTSLAKIKNRIDFHYTAQSIMKGWLFFHIPVTAALMVFGAWHIIVIHVYAV